MESTGWNLRLHFGGTKALRIHDRLVEPLRKIFHLVDGLFFMSWVIIGISIVIGLAIYFLPFVMSLSPRVRFWNVLSRSRYVTGSLILEMVEGKYFCGPRR